MARPKKPTTDVRVNACTMLLPEVLEQVDRIAFQTHRSRSQVIGMFFARGYAAFQRDGSLKDPDDTGNDDEFIVLRPIENLKAPTKTSKKKRS